MVDRATASSRAPALQTRATDFRFWILDFRFWIGNNLDRTSPRLPGSCGRSDPKVKISKNKRIPYRLTGDLSRRSSYPASRAHLINPWFARKNQRAEICIFMRFYAILCVRSWLSPPFLLTRDNQRQNRRAIG